MSGTVFFFLTEIPDSSNFQASFGRPKPSPKIHDLYCIFGVFSRFIFFIFYFRNYLFVFQKKYKKEGDILRSR